MQIINKAKNIHDGEIISGFESESNLKSEINRRSAKAGYTDRDGQPRTSRVTSYGKGDSIRPYDRTKYSENYRKIFGHD